MLVRLHALVLGFASAFSLLAYVGCDNGGDAPDPKSFFVTEDPYARQISGRVLHGTEVVAGANVKIEPVGGFAAYDHLAAAGTAGYQTSTDLGGKYYITNGPFFYDLSVRKDREVVVFRALANRYFEPPLGTDAPLRGYTAHIAPSTMPPAAAGNAVAYFVAGNQARTVVPDGSSLVATFRDFASRVNLHAVEYVASKGLTSAVRWGFADIPVTAGTATPALVYMNEIPLATDGGATDAADVLINAVPPPGFTVSSIELVMDLGLRTSAQVVTPLENNVPMPVQIVRPARYFVHAIAKRGEATADSGLQYFNPFVKTDVLLPRVVKESSYDAATGFTAVADNTICEITPTFGTDRPACRSVVEHVLVPESPSGTSLRLLTTDRVTALPDVTSLGVPAVRGRYTWTVLQYPTQRRVDGISGEDVRVVTPISTTAPRVLDLP